MKKLTDYKKIRHLTDQISVEKVYPLSILEGIQSGEIYVDDTDSPNATLIWHYCGFANILGNGKRNLRSINNVYDDCGKGNFDLQNEINHVFQEGIMSKHLVRNTVLATVTVLLFYFAQGAAVVMGQLEGLKAITVQAAIIWSCALVAIAFFLIEDHSLKGLGLRKAVSGMAVKFLYYIPLIVVALAAFAGGIMFDNSGLYIPNLIFTLGIGLTEELYFRGIICNMWKDNETKAIIISSVLFGLSHLLNVMGGAGLTETLLQMAFAFTYGVVMAFVILRTQSIWPCILLHAFHDFCGFITNEGDMKMSIIVGTIQFVVLLGYCIYLIVKLRGEKR